MSEGGNSCNCSTQEVIKICKCWIPTASKHLYDIQISCQQKHSSDCSGSIDSSNSKNIVEHGIVGSPKSFSLNDPTKFRQPLNNDCHALKGCDPIIPLISQIRDELGKTGTKVEKCVQCCLGPVHKIETAEKQIQCDAQTEPKIRKSASGIIDPSVAYILHNISPSSEVEEQVFSIETDTTTSDDITTYESTTSQTKSSPRCSLQCLEQCNKMDASGVLCQNRISCIQNDASLSYESKETVISGSCVPERNHDKKTDKLKKNSLELKNSKPANDRHSTEWYEFGHHDQSGDLKNESKSKDKFNSTESRKTEFKTPSSRGEFSQRYGSTKSVTFHNKNMPKHIRNSLTESLMNTRDSLEIIKEKTQNQVEELIERGSAFSIYLHSNSGTHLKRKILIGDLSVFDEPDTIYRIKSIHFKNGLLIQPNPLLCRKLQQLEEENVSGGSGLLDKEVQVDNIACSTEHPSLTFLQNFPIHGSSESCNQHEWDQTIKDAAEHEKNWKTYYCNKILYLDF